MAAAEKTAMEEADEMGIPWTELKDEDGTPYYYNSVTKKCRREKPSDFYDANVQAFVQVLTKAMGIGTNQQPAEAEEKQAAKAPEKKSAKAAKKQPAKAAEKQSAKAAKKQPAKAAEKQPAKTALQQPAKAEKQPAKGPEMQQVTGMEVEESEESDFEPVVKSRRKMTTETKVEDALGGSNNQYNPPAENTKNNNAKPATGKTTPVVSPSGKSAGKNDGNNKANPAAGKSTPVVPASGKSAGENDGNNKANPAAGKSTPVVPASGESAGAKKQPPLVVKNMSFARLAKLMSSCDVQPEHKLTRNGIKVTCFSSEDFDTVQAHLKKHSVEFYTHGRRCERPHRVVIRGLPNLEPEFVQKLLKEDHQLNALAVHAIKRKQQLPAVDETPFIVLFPKGHTSLMELRNKVKKMGPIIVRWEAYRSKQPHVTQCKNCLQFGHGTSNCHLKPRCSSCGGPHSTEKCKTEETQAKKCVNCSGSHEGLDRSCPKRAQFIQSRQQATKPKPSAWKKDKRSPVVPAFSAADFPPLPVPVPVPNPDKSKKEDTQAAADAGSKQENTGPRAGVDPKAKGEEAPYSSEELWKMFHERMWRMFVEFTARLRSCKTRSDQERVVGYMARRFGAD